MGLGEIAFRKPPSNLGDFSGNGVLDVNDVNLILQAIAEQKHPAQLDLDNRGTVDAVDLRIWVKDLKHTWFGDADLSGEFDSSDFVQVFEAAEYETGASRWLGPKATGTATGIFDIRRLHHGIHRRRLRARTTDRRGGGAGAGRRGAADSWVLWA